MANMDRPKAELCYQPSVSVRSFDDWRDVAAARVISGAFRAGSEPVRCADQIPPAQILTPSQRTLDRRTQSGNTDRGTHGPTVRKASRLHEIPFVSIREPRKNQKAAEAEPPPLLDSNLLELYFR